MAVLALAVGVMTTACSDWDDHYAASDTAVMAGANGNLWENIKSNEQLTMFANLLEKVGYDSILSSSQTYTVWAPVNSVLAADYARLNSLSNTELMREFVKNHIARNLYTASGSFDQKVLMLNKKIINFSGNGTYAMGNANVVTANIPNYNGVMHLLDNEIAFNYNLYETIDSTKFPFDSLHAFFAKYERRVFIPSSSVAGSVVNGEITYIDSVFNEDNALFYSRYAYLNREDSSYTMIAPSDIAWTKAYENISKYFNYVDGYKFIDRSDNPIDTVINFNAGYLRDSLIKLSITEDLFFNNHYKSNKNLVTLQPGQAYPAKDSLFTTQYTRFYTPDATEMFVEGQKLERSNGYMWIVDSLRIFPWRSFAPIIKIEAEYAYTVVPENYRSSIGSVTATTQNDTVPGRVSGHRYLEVWNDASATANPTFHMYLPNVLSTTYAIFGVFVPAHIVDESIDPAKVLPNRVRAQMYYNQANGTQSRTPRTIGTITTNQEKVDTVKFGEFEFPIAYRGAATSGQTGLPSLTFTGQARSGREDYNIRLDCVILVPKELILYIQEHPEYLEYYPEYKNFL